MAHATTRGILAVRAQGDVKAVLENLNADWQSFKQQHRAEIEEVRAAHPVNRDVVGADCRTRRSATPMPTWTPSPRPPASATSAVSPRTRARTTIAYHSFTPAYPRTPSVRAMAAPRSPT